ncbi:MAG: hypothetical protein ACRC1D_09550 [Culicoidibacterales bacterium]
MFDWLWDQLLGGAWWLVEGITFFTDEMWNGVYALISPETMNNILNLPIVEQVLTATITLGSALIILSLVVTLLKNMIELDGQHNTLIYRRAIFAVIWMSLSLAVFQFSVPIAGKLTQAAASISGTTTANKMAISSNIVSSLLAQSTSNPQTYQKQILEQMQKKTFNPALRCQDSKGMCKSGVDAKAHVFNVGVIFIAGLISALVGVLTLVIGIQVARRLLEVMVLKILAPLCASSWISDMQAQRARQWQKMAVGVLLATAGQILALSLGIIVISQINTIISASTNGAFVYAYILLILGVMMFVVFSPNTINTLVDGQTSMSEGLQELIAVGQASNIARGIGGMAKGMTTTAIGAAGAMTIGGANLASTAMTGMNMGQLHTAAQQFYQDNPSSGRSSGSVSTPSDGTPGSSIQETQGTYQNASSGLVSSPASQMNTPNGIIPRALAATQATAQAASQTYQQVANSPDKLQAVGSEITNGWQSGQQMMKGVATRVGQQAKSLPPVQTAQYASALLYAQTVSQGSSIKETPIKQPINKE